MRSRIILGAVVVASVAAFAACGSDATVTPLSSTTYISVLTTANEVPPKTSSGAGTATYTLTGTTLSYVVTITSPLTGPATAGHIHVGAAGTAPAGNIIVPFVTAAVVSGNVTSGLIDLTQPICNGTPCITGDSLKVLLNNGMAYTNVHTTINAGGEIRGQIVLKP